MDVFFEPQRGSPFSIELGYFDTVLEIKEKVLKYRGIPVNKQTLVFNGQVLQDDRDIEYCEILHNSHIQLLIAPDNDNKPQPQIKIEESSPSNKIQLSIKIPSSKMLVPLEMDVDDTILQLKEKIHEIEPVPTQRLILQSSGVELKDNHSLRECELMDNSEINVNIRPSSTGLGIGSTGGATTGTKKLKLMVLPKCGTKKIPVEVNASDNVGELRKELQKLSQRLHFHLPPEGYFFIYKQNVMDDDRSFRWHHVCQGDTVEIFNGSITGGS
ncbi:hypothetical protein P3X46_033397 [Hevea brasiliensis]|uniref:Ubiquitin-like domain-containing protein n=1 Tax=Hevea brasiliensis TaxID=3981 RepID=A0ABQ9KHH9_HEVBR|nr:ubiquitin domain-containing protein 7SL RNA1-like [Hevea brasiliensis]KAJ9136306.1 hypothetical protein P3X46_033397 [Hevea brasiliensis]